MLSLATLLTLTAGVLAAPTNVHPKYRRAETPGAANRYIVKLKDGADKGASIASIGDVAGIAEVGTDIVANVIYDDWTIINAYAAELSPAVLDQVLADDNVEFVEEDGTITINFDVQETSLEERSPEPVVAHLNKRQTGSGVNIYSVDTGVYTAHSAFGGRASWGATFGGYANADGNGHGTHTMGIAAGSGFGPATSASIIAVKVLSDSGSGSFSDVISGVNWAANAGAASGRPSVINLSLGGSASTSVDSAVSGAVSAGVHVTIAAGNDNANAGNYSPARVTSAVTVGAISSAKAKASFSNYGAVIDVHFLGVSVRSAYIGSTTATATLSGTSMAAPGVAGILAVELSKANASPASLQASLKSNAVADATGFPSGTTNLRAVVW
ncbi:serine protease [Atractiella rhizophila]|nr:serine protease [Atractiella rhizophila]